MKVELLVRWVEKLTKNHTIGDATESHALRNSFLFPFSLTLSLSLPKVILILKHTLDI